MTAVSDVLARALGLHQAGQLAAAEQLYRQILQAEPSHFDALHLLGVALHHRGDNERAGDVIGQALRLRPTFAVAHYNLGLALAALGKLDEAIASYREALRLTPEGRMYNNLGVALKKRNELREAADLF